VADQRALHAQRGAGADDALDGLLGDRAAQLDRVVVVAHDGQVLAGLDDLLEQAQQVVESLSETKRCGQ
jgi:hypothetical protein